MADIFHLLPEQCATVKMAIAWHDTIIEYDKAHPNNILAMIRRHRGAREGDQPKGVEGNEGKSAQLLKGEMDYANKLTEQEIFTEEQIYNAVWSIHSTYPDVKGIKFKEYPYYGIAITQNPEIGPIIDELEKQGIDSGLLFFQPHLEKPLEEGQRVPKEVLIVSLADLGAAGTAEKEVFFKEGDDEMRELYANLQRPDIIHHLVNGDEEQDRVDREKVSAAFLGWMGSQSGFAVCQALRFEKILSLLKQQDDISPSEEQGLRLQFSHFIDNIRNVYARAEKLRAEFEAMKSREGEKAAFLYLAKNLHYEISSS